MTPDLQDFTTGDLAYIAKHNANNASLRSNIDALLTAISSSSVSVGPFLTSLFGVQTAFIGSASYTHSEATTIMTLSAGWAWRPDLGQVVSKGISSPLNFSGQSAGTYYIQLDAAGSPSISATLATPLYSVVWTGSAFGTITRLAPTVWNFEDWTLAQTSAALTQTFISLSARFEYDETLLAAVAVTPQTANKIYSGPATGSPAAPTFRASVVADLPFAGSALGVATLDGGGKVPSSQLPASVAGAMSFVSTWNATTNSPTLASGVGTKGNFYKVATAGTTSIDGISVWNVGDSIVFDGTTWDKIDGITNEVISVAGKFGVVVLASGDIAGLAAHTIIGNNTAGTAAGIELTAAQVKTMLAIAAGDVSGLAASATTDTTNASNISGGTLAAARVGAIRMHLSTFLAGLQTTATQCILSYEAAIAMTLPSSGNRASARVASTGTAVFTIKQNGSSIGTITYTASATGVVAITGGPLTIAIGDIIDIFGPGTADATLSDIRVTLATTAAGA